MGVHLSHTTPGDPSGSTNIVGDILDGSGGLGAALGQGLAGIVNGIADAIGGILSGTIFDRVALEMQYFRDGQEALSEETDLLSPLLDYGSSYVDPNNRGPGGANAPIPFTKQLGPMRGCEMIGDAEGGIRLLDKGLWDIRVHVSMDSYVHLTQSGQARVHLQVFTPNGQLYSEQIANETSLNVITFPIASSVVVPEAGYLVRVWCSHNQRSDRKALGGPAWSRLTVQHIAREVNGPWSTGDEVSDEAADG